MFKSILLQSCLGLLVAAAILGVLVGSGMLMGHERLLRLNQYFSRWTSTDKFGDQLDRPRWTERFFYRHHRLVGASLFLGAIIVLNTFLFSYNLRQISVVIPRDYWWLLDALLGLLLIGSVPAAIIGFIIMTKPSLLRDIETAANRWISTDPLLKYLNAMDYSLERNILQRRKMVGVCLIFGSLYILGALGWFLFRSAGKF
ncbi:MAG: hypothetical protein PHQ05_13320 [Sterolibacterium sp.]|nr:hypothetical protein [Sterolibacterium sp.]